MKKLGVKLTFRVLVSRSNGRVVKEYIRESKYAAKRQKRRLEDKYDDTYVVTIEPITSGEIAPTH